MLYLKSDADAVDNALTELLPLFLTEPLLMLL